MKQIEPSKHLKYRACFNGFQCARLKVPLNWNTSNREIGPRAAIAVIKIPAKVPVTDERYGGAILMNPGRYFRLQQLDPADDWKKEVQANLVFIKSSQVENMFRPSLIRQLYLQKTSMNRRLENISISLALTHVA